MFKKITLVFIVPLIASCSMNFKHPAERGSVSKLGQIPVGAKMAIVPFSNCSVIDNSECAGSGNAAGTEFSRVFASGSHFDSELIPRPVGSNDLLTDKSAVTYAKSKGFEYVMNGEVTAFYDAEPVSGRRDQVGITLRILNTENEKIIFSYQHLACGMSNFDTTNEILNVIARHIRNCL